MVTNKKLLDVIVSALEFNKKSVETNIKYAENASDNEINSKNIRDFNNGIAFASRDELGRINRLLEGIKNAKRKPSKGED